MADARVLPFRQEIFDFIICLELTEHLSKRNQHKLCQGLYTILKKNSFLFISTPNKLWFSPLYRSLNPAHVRELHLTDLIKILKNSGCKYCKLYSMGSEENSFSYLINIFKYIFRSILPNRVINIIDQSLSFKRMGNKHTRYVDPNPNYPIRKVSNSIWRFKWFIVKASTSKSSDKGCRP